MKKADLLITGMGVISASGRGLEESLLSMRRGQRNAGLVTGFESGLTCPVFEVKDIPPEYLIPRSRTLSLALCAVSDALKSASLSSLSGLRVGVCLGTTVASQLNDLDFYRTYRKSADADMAVIERYLKGNIAEFIANKFGASGPVLSVVNACSSGTDAIGTALSWVRNGLCDMAIAGGADELNMVPLCGFNSLGIVNQSLCAPFDRDRKGLNLGEGAGVLVLESKASAEKRGISSGLLLMGYGAAADAYHLTAPRPDGKGLERSINRALSEAGLSPSQIGFVNAHGTGTLDNDLVEGNTLARIFGPDLKMVSTKGYTGHTLGAAGGIEAVFAAGALQAGWLPASAGFQNRDEAISLAPLEENTDINGQYALSTSLAFGGNNAALVIGKVS